MKNTIFQELTKNYRIKYPYQNLPPKQFFIKLESLAKAFYQSYYRLVLKTMPTHPFLKDSDDISQHFS